MRVLYVMDCLYGDAGGGSERQFLSFYERCPEFGIDVHVCFLRHDPIHDQIGWRLPPLTLNIESPFSLTSIRATRELSAYIKEHDIELVQTLFDDAAIFAGLLYMRYFGRQPPLIIGLRNSGHTHRGLVGWLLKPVYSMARHFIVNSDLAAAHLRDDYHVKSPRISVIRNIYAPVDRHNDNRLQDLSAKLRKCFDTIAIVVANLRPVKGIDDLLLAIAQLKQPDIVFLFVGSGEKEQEYGRLADELGITPQVKFLGRRDDVTELLAIADFGLLPSHAEGLSNSLIEYVMAGLPVIATNVGGNPEVIQDGRNGLLVPPHDADSLAKAISRLRVDFAGFKAGAERQRDDAADCYSLPNIIGQYRAQYINLCRDSAR